MHFSWTALFVVICFAGTQCLMVPFPSDEEIDNISDTSDDILVTGSDQSLESSKEESGEEILTNAPAKDDDAEQSTKTPEPCPDPRVYGMNIGLHYVLEDINKRVVYGDRVHLESLIKVLVLTHKIEKAGGNVDGSNKHALKKVAKLYPEALRKAINN